MKKHDDTDMVMIGFLIGVFVMVGTVVAFGIFGLFAEPEYRYIIKELNDAIATREANFAEKAIELNESR